MRSLISIILVLGITAIPAAAFALPVQCSCVMALRELQGVDIHGNADAIPPNVETEFVRTGDVLLFHYSKEDHVALVTSIAEPSENYLMLTFVEYNYHHCKKSVRTVAINDPSIRGVYRPNLSPYATGYYV